MAKVWRCKAIKESKPYRFNGRYIIFIKGEIYFVSTRPGNEDLIEVVGIFIDNVSGKKVKLSTTFTKSICKEHLVKDINPLSAGNIKQIEKEIKFQLKTIAEEIYGNLKLNIVINNWDDLKDQFKLNQPIGSDYKTAKEISFELKTLAQRPMEYPCIFIAVEENNVDSAQACFRFKKQTGKTLFFDYEGTAK
jgi:hypothetical protein